MASFSIYCYYANTSDRLLPSGCISDVEFPVGRSSSCLAHQPLHKHNIKLPSLGNGRVGKRRKSVLKRGVDDSISGSRAKQVSHRSRGVGRVLMLLLFLGVIGKQEGFHQTQPIRRTAQGRRLWWTTVDSEGGDGAELVVVLAGVVWNFEPCY